MKHETINFTLIIKLQNSEVKITTIRDLEPCLSENLTLNFGICDGGLNHLPSIEKTRDGLYFYYYSVELQLIFLSSNYCVNNKFKGSFFLKTDILFPLIVEKGYPTNYMI